MLMDRAEPITPERFSLVLVDFDHTILGANSTELFIKHARPQWLAALFHIFLRKIVPWRWMIGSNAVGRYRDYACVYAIIIGMPWSLFAWRRKAPSLFQDNKSHEVESLLSRCDPGEVSIITFGFEPVVGALVAQSRWAKSKLIATPFRASQGYLKMRKFDIARMHFADEAIASAFFVTDSDDDGDLLTRVGQGVKIVPQGITKPGRRETYFPLKYVAFVKYGRSYVLDQFLFVDLCIWLLSIGSGSLSSMLAAGILLLSLSCIYEIGYYENDIEITREKHPVLTGKEKAYSDYQIRSRAWFYAFVSFLFAEALLSLNGEVGRTDFSCLASYWIGLLLVLRIVFHFYNKSSPAWRLFMYPCLQGLKYFSLLIFFVVPATGFCLLLSQVVVMSANYAGYRLRGKRKFIDRDRWRGLVFASLCLCLLALGFSLNPFTSFAFIILWLAARASKPFIVALFRARSTTSARALKL